MNLLIGTDKGIYGFKSLTYDDGVLNVGEKALLADKYINFCFSDDFTKAILYNHTKFKTSTFLDDNICLCKYSNNSFEEKGKVSVPNISSVGFSPNGKYFYCISVKTNRTVENNTPTVHVFDSETLEIVKTFNYEGSTAILHFSADEEILCFSSSNDIVFCKTNGDDNLDVKEKKFDTLECVAFANTESGDIRISCVHGASKKYLSLYQYPDLEKPIKEKDEIQLCNSYNVFLGKYGKTSVALGKKESSSGSYYGDTVFFYLDENGFISLPFAKGGTVHSITYSKYDERFCMIHGNLPPAASVYRNCNDFKHITQDNFNSVIFSPNKVTIALGGFQSFSGKTAVYDIRKPTKISEGVIEDVSKWSWSPCGRLIQTSVLFQMLRTGNCVKIFNHMLDELFCFTDKEIYQSDWIGLPDPKPLPNIKKKEVVKKAPAYVPPHLRNKK